MGTLALSGQGTHREYEDTLVIVTSRPWGLWRPSG